MNIQKSSLKNRRRALTASIASLLSLGATAGAQQTWVGDTSTDWNTASNWSGGALPGGNATINTTPLNIATISADLLATPVDIFVGNGAGSNGRLDHTAGIAGTGNNNWMFVGVNGGTGTYNLADTSMTGGTLTGFGTGSGSMNVGGPSTTSGRLYIGGRDNGTGGTGTVNVNTTGTLKIGNDLVIGSRGGTGVMNIDAGTVTTNGWNFIGVQNGVDGGNGTLRMSGGTLTNLNSRTYVGLGNATGSMVMTGGTYNNTGTSVDTQFAIGVGNNANPTTASVTMSGGTINANRLFAIGGTEGFGGNGGSTGAGKGSFTMDGAGALLNVTGELWVGNAAGSVGTMNVSAGTVQVNNWVAVGRNASNGTLTLSGTGRIEKTGAGNFEVGGGAGGVGVLNLNGGTLNTHNITRNGAGTGTVNLNGGVLQANQSNVAFLQNLSNVFVKAGGAVIDTQQFNITIAQSLIADAVSTGGGLTKIGSGELALTGTSDYTGVTTVNGGTLALREFGTIGGTSGIVVNGVGAKLLQNSGLPISKMVTVTTGTLDGTGIVDQVTVRDGTGGIITNGAGTGSQLNIGSLTFNGDGAISALIADPAIPAISVGTLTTGAVDLEGKISLNAATTAGIWTNGQAYTLVQYGSIGGAGIGAFQAGTVAGLGARQSASMADTGTSILLEIAGDFPVWTGALDGRWTTAELPNPKNWVLQTQGTATDFIAGDIAFFDDAAVTPALNITDGNVNITSVVFDNSQLHYSVSSSEGFGITGGSISKKGSASLTLTTANSHTGGTTLSNGTLNINHASALGTGTLTIENGLIDNTSVDPITVSTNNAQRWISGLTFLGTNTLNLGEGPVTLGADSADQTITITNNSTLPGNSLIVGGAVSSATGGTPGVKTLAFVGSGNTVFSGNITPGGATAIVINNNLPGTLTLSGAASNIRTLNMNGGAGSVVDLGAGNLTAANGGANILQSTTGGSLLATDGGVFTIGSANGDFGTAAGTMLLIGAKLAGTAAVDFYSPNGALGTIVLAAANTHTGGVNVENTRVVVPEGGAINAPNTNNSGQLNVGTFDGARAILSLEGGTINATKGGAPSAVVGNANGSVGVFHLSDGTFNTTSEFWVGSAAGAYGAFVMDGGSATVGSWLPVGRNGSGYMNMSGGTLNVTTNNFTMGSFTGANGTLPGSFGVVQLTGGGVNVTSTAANQGGFIVGESGTAHLTVDDDAALTIAGARGLHFATNATGIGVANLNGGIVTTPLVQKGAGSGVLNFGGGTLKASAGSATFLQNLTSAYVNSGGAIVDDSGFAITIGQALLAPTGDGVASINVSGGTGYIGAPLVQITGDGTGATAIAEVDENGNITGIQVTNPGVNYTNASAVLIGGGGTGAVVDTVGLAPNESGGFTKRGTGTTTLSAVNTYTGPTVIEAGTLALLGSISGSEIIDVKAGAAFDVSGILAGFNLASGQSLAGAGSVIGQIMTSPGSQIAPGDSIGTLSLNGSLDLSGAVTDPATGALLFELGAPGNGDQVKLNSGTLTIGTGLLGFNDFMFTTLAGFGQGVYTLFDAVGTINGTLDQNALSGDLGGGFIGTLAITEGGDDLTLTVVPEPGSAVMLLAGLGILASRRRSRAANREIV